MTWGNDDVRSTVKVGPIGVFVDPLRPEPIGRGHREI